MKKCFSFKALYEIKNSTSPSTYDHYLPGLGLLTGSSPQTMRSTNWRRRHKTFFRRHDAAAKKS
jgi:hypothetical protein